MPSVSRMLALGGATGLFDGLERRRIANIRVALAAADPACATQAGQRGIFSLLPLTPTQVARLRDEHAIYMPASGRINVAGLTAGTTHGFARAVAACAQGGRS